MNKTVLVDLDGVLADYRGWTGIENIGKPIIGAKEFMQRLHDAGFHVAIYTTRCCTSVQVGYTTEQLVDIVKSWLNKHGIYFDDVWASQGKPHSIAIVGDRGVNCQPQKYDFAFEDAFDLVMGMADENWSKDTQNE